MLVFLSINHIISHLSFQFLLSSPAFLEPSSSFLPSLFCGFLGFRPPVHWVRLFSRPSYPRQMEGRVVPILYHTNFCYFLSCFWVTYSFPLLCLYLQSLRLYNTLSSGKVSISVPSLSFFLKMSLARYHYLLLWQIGVAYSVLCISHFWCCPKEKLSLKL